ncbi:MAG: hypothetical protein RDV41_00580 [Planctomycetota bacterium]|nr:hypothetical protein [Planctomycetota bacterium]
MKRSFGVGDIITTVGTALYFGFMLAMWIVCLSDNGFIFPVALNMLILVLMTAIPVTVLIMSLGRPALLNVQFGFAGLIVLLTLTNANWLAFRGYEFYITLGALMVGFGAHVSRSGLSIIGLSEEAEEKKKK